MNSEVLASTFCTAQSCGYYRHSQSIFDEPLKRSNSSQDKIYTFKTMLGMY